MRKVKQLLEKLFFPFQKTSYIHQVSSYATMDYRNNDIPVSLASDKFVITLQHNVIRIIPFFLYMLALLQNWVKGLLLSLKWLSDWDRRYTALY